MKRRPLRPPYQDWEVRRLLDLGSSFEAQRTRLAIILIRYAGLRLWEVTALRFGDHREPRRLRLPPRRRGITVPVIDLHPTVQEALTQWRQRVNAHLTPGIVSDETPMMYSKKEGPFREHALDRCSLGRDLIAAHRQARLRGRFAVEALRRAYGLSVGPDIRKASELLRHGDPSTTADYLGIHDQHSDVVAVVLHMWHIASQEERQFILSVLSEKHDDSARTGPTELTHDMVDLTDAEPTFER